MNFTVDCCAFNRLDWGLSCAVAVKYGSGGVWMFSGDNTVPRLFDGLLEKLAYIDIEIIDFFD